MKTNRTLRSRFLAGGFGAVTVMLATTAVAWACTGHGTGMSESFVITPTNQGVAANALVRATGRMGDETLNTSVQTLPSPFASDFPVSIYWHVIGPDDDSTPLNKWTGINHGGREVMPCHVANTVGDSAYVGNRVPNPTTAVFDFHFRLPDYRAVNNAEGEGPSRQAVMFCALEGGGGDAAWTSQPVVLIY